MEKVRIVFNRSNIDAICAAVLLINNCKQKGISVETVPYSMSSYSKPSASSSSNKTYVLGCFMEPHELIEELNCTDNGFVFLFTTETIDSEHPYRKIMQESANRFCVYSPNFWCNNEIVELDQCFSPCLSKLVKFELNPNKYGDLPTPTLMVTEEEKEFQTVLNGVEAFTNIKDVSASDILIVHENYDNLIHSAYTGTPMEFVTLKDVQHKLTKDPVNPDKFIIKSNNPRIFKARSFIQNSMTTQLFGNQKSSALAQTIQITEEYLYDIVRLATYPYDVVVTYQDHKHFRHWWIYSATDQNAKNIAELIPYLRKVNDGKLIHLVSNIPKMTA
jgi:hypothetical protein